MTILSKPLRRQLETTVKQARDIAEDAAKEAIARIGVAEAEAPAHLSDDNKALRRRLRAHARTLGDTPATGALTTTRLQDATSYEIWHRMLFGRFLAERGLLIHPELGATMSVAELRDLAKEEEAADEWALAERYAAPRLPGVFKPDDPVLALPIAPEFLKRLRSLLSGLPEEVFTADDSLGWTYQFWRASEKDAVNAAGGKIGAAELPAVTQLFTESYMVKFLLHNTLGAWWAGKVLARDPDLARDAADEDVLREACAIPGVTWEFLRFIRDDGQAPWRPAAGTFPGWPVRAAEITYCDPCCGSGHFLVEAFFILAAMRQNEEGLSAADTAILVLTENLHGLELDGRCVQIATFNVALAAWKLIGAPVALPSPLIAWVGAPPPMSRLEMAGLAKSDASLRTALEALHDQFVQAPLLGSLLKIGARDLLDADLRERGGAALEMLRDVEPEQAEGGIAARGLLDAASLLAKRYVLQATNVPFRAAGTVEEQLRFHLEQNFPLGKRNLATAMVERILSSAQDGGVIACVTPKEWLSARSFRDFRSHVLTQREPLLFAGLGPNAFESIGGEVVNVCLVIIGARTSGANQRIVLIDVPREQGAALKALSIISLQPLLLTRSDITKRRDLEISSLTSATRLLSDYVSHHQGLATGDLKRFSVFFWEIEGQDDRWVYWQGSITSSSMFAGRERVLLWEHGNGSLHTFNEENKLTRKNTHLRGLGVLGKAGVLITQMGSLPASLFSGERYDDTTTALIPMDPANLPAIWSFVSSEEYSQGVRQVDSSIKVPAATLSKVAFDIDEWSEVASQNYPAGLPEPYSDDPTQWIFHGAPSFSETGTELHVAFARLAGYRWPAELDSDMRLSEHAKECVNLASSLPRSGADAILLLHAYGAELSLADRLRTLLASAYGAPLSLSEEQALVRAADARLDRKEARNITLEAWLADRAFRQHCILFQQRPFLWHVWDGMNGGFSAFLNYHRLDRAALDKLTYTLLGDWIRAAKAGGSTARIERAEQLQQKLAKIIEGESPYDIFVRWKTLGKQPLGWEPDHDDGVRLNIRPFMTAGILREQPRGISWSKDRGADAPSAPWYDLGPRYGGKQGDRINDHHTTLAEKQTARGMS